MDIFFEPSGFLQSLLVRVIFFMSFVILALMGVLLIHNIQYEIRKRKREYYSKEYIAMVNKFIIDNREYQRHEYSEKYRDFINKYMSDKEHSGVVPDIQLKSAVQYETLIDICIEVILSVDGPELKKIMEVCDSLGLVTYLKKQSKSFYWIKRYYAIEKLGLFRIEELREFFTDKLFDDKNERVKENCLLAMSFIATDKELKIITETMSNDIFISFNLQKYIYSNIIRSFRKKGQIDSFLNYMNDIKNKVDIPSLLKKSAIEACGSQSLKESKDILKDYYYSFIEDPEMRISCIKSIGMIGSHSAHKEMILVGLNDNVDTVRLVATKSITEFDDDIIDELKQLLYDNNYYVRIEVAKKLNQIEVGKQILEKEVESEDRFVRDTVKYVLEISA